MPINATKLISRPETALSFRLPCGCVHRMEVVHTEGLPVCQHSVCLCGQRFSVRITVDWQLEISAPLPDVFSTPPDAGDTDA